MKALNAAELCTLEWPRWGLPGGPVVRTPVPWGAGSLPGRETKIPHALWCTPSKEEKKKSPYTKIGKTRTHPKRESHVDINTLPTPPVPGQSVPDPATRSPDIE